MSNKKTVLITGGSGFIGSHTVDLFINKGFKVRVIDNLVGGNEDNILQHKNNPDFEFINSDINLISPSNSFFRDLSSIIHFAGIGDIVPSIEDPVKYMETNVMGTINILEAVRKNKIGRFVYAASSSCYGQANTPTDENHPISPEYPYALSKYQGELAAMHWRKVYGLSVNSIRIFNAYGTRVKTTGAYGAVFGVFFKQKLSNSPLTIVGDGTQSRDFVYVSDVAEAFFLASQTPIDGEVFNLGANNPQSIIKLAAMISSDHEFIPKRPGEPECTWANINKITNLLGWLPKISFEQGFGLMIKEIDNWSDAPLWDKKSIDEATKTWFKYMTKEK